MITCLVFFIHCSTFIKMNLLHLMPHYLVNFVHFRNTLKKAQIFGSSYAFSHAFIYFAYAVGFRFGAYLIQAGRVTPEGMFV